MNIYRVIALVVSIIVFAHVFDAVKPISHFIKNITDVPRIGSIGHNPFYPVFIRLVFLIAGLGALRMILRKRD